MQNYGQQPGYQRPGSAASFAGQQTAPQPPAYGGYQSTAPQNQGQWGAPPPPPPQNQQWNQPPQQAASGYNPGTYGAMPGGHQTQYTNDQPPPPPPKPYGFAGAVQQQQSTQGWGQQPQQSVNQTPPQQGGYPVQGGGQHQQQSYNNAAPPPPSATPGGSYFPPASGGRPGSIYGANQVGSFSSPLPPGGPPQPSTVVSPNEQQPAYIPPSLTGQGVQAYMPSNTNPMPGVYVPPPPDVPAWQQAQHAPLQGGMKKFRYTKPTVDPSFYAQGYQGVQPMQPQPQQQQPQPLQNQYVQSPSGGQPPQQPFGQPGQNQYAQPGQGPQQGPPVPNQYPGQQPQHGQYTQPQPQQQVYGQPTAQPHPQQPAGPPPPDAFNPIPPMTMASNVSKPHNDVQMASNVSKPYNDYQLAPAPITQPFMPQNTQTQWQPGHNTAQGSQISFGGQPAVAAQAQDLEAPRPLGRTDTASSNFFNQPSPQSQPVSPVNNRNSVSFGSSQQIGLGRTGSVSSIALANLHSQREGNRTSSPRPPPPKLPTPPPPRDDKSRFSALGSGGPSDWEHFGADAEIDDEEIFAKKPQPAQLDSVELPASQPELPAGPSPPSTHGWPSPATQPAPLMASGRQDTYQPTPPPVVAHLAEQPPSQQNFVMGDAAPAPLSISPKPIQGGRPPSTQQSFVMGDETSAWGPQPTQQHAAELKAKDEAIERLRADAENEKHELLAELERLRVDAQMTRTTAADEKASLLEQIEAMKNAVDEKNGLQEQLSAMKITTEQAKTNADSTVKERELTIERMKEDAEGKEHNIEERDAIIADLRRQLEAEKSKEPVKVTPVAGDLIPDLDPWYAGSLQRYITMLRGEAGEAQVEDKINTFRAFMKAESGIRGIEFYDAPPPPPPPAPVDIHGDGASNLSRDISEVTRSPEVVSNISTKPFLDHKQELNVQVPPAQDSPDDDDYDYSPGGRPVLKRKSTIPVSDHVPGQQQIIYTPTSSVDDNRTPVQSPPEELQKPQYQAYVPPALFSTSSASNSNRQSVVETALPASMASNIAQSTEHRPALPSNSSAHHDEIFFGAAVPESSKVTSRPTSSDSTTPSVPIPAPLTLSSSQSASTAPPSRKDPSDALNNLLPSKVSPITSNSHIEELKTKIAGLKLDTANRDELTKEWDKSAAVIRKKNDAARRKRQEENEENNDDAFNNNEISYADLNVLEEEFKEKEGELKAQEDRDEYRSYVEAVFDHVYDALQSDIKGLMDLYIETENFLRTSASGVESLHADNDAPNTEACLELLQDLHDRILDRQDHVVAAVAERDKRYKKTEIQPLYAAGNITKMKAVEKHFENAEKQAIVRAKRDKASRAGELVGIAEEVVVHAVGVEQREIDAIIAAIRNLDDASADSDLLARAQDTLTHLKSSSKSLLSLFNNMEIAHNAAVLDAEIAQAKAENADASRITQLEEEKTKGEKKFMDEFQRRVEVIEQDKSEIEGLIAQKGGKGSEEVEKDRRMKAALEEAKRRNGHA
ncbi:hypothetical protein FB567DRAFT_572294 [Paraphoma chrysanthemicola]|uniref:Uncharacterized protein n=1 Tax=Paraphoma chrysanthemicola TaxID=798071 RepID=A0A8K0VUI8_9PLEO|nr:hypothetical protein FB567DRAFT_572294 [Paraphoma chrysanthemicola]